MVARWPEFGEHIFRTLLARRAWHEAEGHGVMRLIAAARLAARVRGARPARAQPAAGALVRRRHRRRERRDARLARHPARGDAGARPRHQRDAQPVRRRRSRARSGCAPRSTASASTSSCSAPGRPGLAAAVYGGSEGLRTFVAEAWAPGGQAGTSTRIENYLGFPTGISGTELTRKATLQARRFDAVLSSFHRAVELADGPEGLRARRPRRRPARARPLGRDGDRRALARAAGRGRRPLPRRRRLPRGDGRPTPSAAATRT